MKKQKTAKTRKPKYTTYEKRAYYIGYGIGLAQTKDKYGSNNGRTFLDTGHIATMQSANAGAKKARENKDNPYKRGLMVIPPKER